jgi:hypothetical protein
MVFYVSRFRVPPGRALRLATAEENHEKETIATFYFIRGAFSFPPPPRTPQG